VEPVIQPVALCTLPYMAMHPATTLYIPPPYRPAADYATMWAMGMT
jgi:hypothetical protein